MKIKSVSSRIGERVRQLVGLFILLFLVSIKGEAANLLNEQVSKFNQDIVKSQLTVDVEIYRFQKSKMKWETIFKNVQFAKKVFRSVGVEIYISKFLEIKSDKERTIHGVKPKNIPAINSDGYKKIESQKYFIPQETIRFLTPILNPGLKTLKVVVLNTAFYSFYEKNKKNKWEIKTIKTGGFSFPSYLLNDGGKGVLSGLITLSSEKSSTLAHEMGHKLINVSHEGYHVGPHHSGNKIPGLMGYEGKSDIGRGQKGRWHMERLHLSPYLYRNVEGQKIFNKPYKEKGQYADPLYGSFYIKH